MILILIAVIYIAALVLALALAASAAYGDAIAREALEEKLDSVDYSIYGRWTA